MQQKVLYQSVREHVKKNCMVHGRVEGFDPPPLSGHFRLVGKFFYVLPKVLWSVWFDIIGNAITLKLETDAGQFSQKHFS